MNSVQLSWESVIRYINGYNYYMSCKDKNWNEDSLVLHTIELYHHIRGSIIKIKKNDRNNEIILDIENFIKKIDIKKLREDVIIWK